MSFLPAVYMGVPAMANFPDFQQQLDRKRRAIKKFLQEARRDNGADLAEHAPEVVSHCWDMGWIGYIPFSSRVQLNTNGVRALNQINNCIKG